MDGERRPANVTLFPGDSNINLSVNSNTQHTTIRNVNVSPAAHSVHPTVAEERSTCALNEVWTKLVQKAINEDFEDNEITRDFISLVIYYLATFLPSIIKTGEPVVRFNSFLAIGFINEEISVKINASFVSFCTNLIAENFAASRTLLLPAQKHLCALKNRENS